LVIATAFFRSNRREHIRPQRFPFLKAHRRSKYAAPGHAQSLDVRFAARPATALGVGVRRSYANPLLLKIPMLGGARENVPGHSDVYGASIMHKARGSGGIPACIWFMTYPKPIEPPAPGHPKALALDDPKPTPSGGSVKPSPNRVGKPKSTASGPLACSVRARSILPGLSTRTRSTSPPQARAPYTRASARSFVCMFPAGISALRQAGPFMSATVFGGLLVAFCLKS
jgi:hypothetical protein